MGAEYACSLIACLWSHALLQSTAADVFSKPELGDNVLLNWMQIGVFLYQSNGFEAFRRAFTTANLAFKSIDIIRDSMIAVAEQNGLCTDDTAVLNSFVAGHTEALSESLYVTLPEAITLLFRMARQRADKRIAAVFTSGHGFTSCIYVSSQRSSERWNIMFLDSHWNDPVTGDNVNRLERAECVRMKAAAVWIKFESESALVNFLLKRFRSNIKTSDVAQSLTPYSMFHLSIFAKNANWDRSASTHKIDMTGFAKWRESVKRNSSSTEGWTVATNRI